MDQHWLDQRSKGIGGSDAAPILGLSPYKTAYQVWEEKVGRSAGQPDNPAMAYGRLMEPVIRQWYANETGRTVGVPQSVLTHHEHPFVLGSLDGITDDGRVVEIKTARSPKGWGEPGSDEIPVPYMAQVQHYLMVTGLSVADVVVSIGGTMPQIYEVPSDRELQEMLLTAEVEFWQLVQEKIPPEPVSYSDMLTRFGRASRSQSVTANNEALAAVSELRALRLRVAEMEEREADLKAVIMGALRDSDTLVDDSGQVLVTWKASKPSQRLDQMSLMAAEPELCGKYMVTSDTTRRFLIK